MRVLIADDEPVARRLLRAQLEKAGHDVVAAEDGAQALAALTGPDAPRLAVLDWNMPGLDGVDVCRKLRSLPPGGSNPYTYVLLLTSRQTQADLVAGLESGANDFISKPVDGEVLRARLRVGERLLEMEAEIHRYSAYLGAVLANIGSGVVLVDTLGRIVFANPAVVEMAGVPADEVLGWTRSMLLERFAARAADPGQFQPVLAAGAPDAPDNGGLTDGAPLELTDRRFLHWSGKPVALPGGQGWLDLFRDVSSEVALNRALAEAANTDHLTRLLNRRGGQLAIAREVARARRDRSPLAFAMFDVDRFKRINDTLGHAAGDQVIAAVTAAVSASVRGYDLPIRWGGEEVLVVLPGAELPDARTVCERVRAAVADIRLDGIPPITISAGVALLVAGEGTAEAAIARADEQLYQAKAGGRDRVCG
jgi:two-component system cell cycle response regulator